MKKNLAIFASGSGTNAENIGHYFKDHPTASVALILSNKPDAYVLERARKLQVPTLIFDRESFYHSDRILDEITRHRIDFIILAGFLWLVPTNILKAFPNRIVNIHPALLPKYGGKGMYGDRVHQAVKESGDAETGITIHLVNEKYDEGKIVFQARCKVDPEDTPDDIARKVHALEYKHFPVEIEKILNNAGSPAGFDIVDV